MILFQTLEDRNNYEDILANGPFQCNRRDAWLTSGYYFWEGHVELAHWWGGNAYDSYVITKVILSNLNEIYDLYNNANHRDELRKTIDELKRLKELPKNANLPEILVYLRKFGIFKYKGIRMEGKDSFKAKYHKKWGTLKVFIKSKNNTYLDLIPAIQFCIFDISILKMETYEIIHPEGMTNITDEELF